MSKKSYSKKSKTNYKKRKVTNEQMNEVFKTLEEGVKSVFSSESYQKYLEFLSLFHNYSLNNILLILSQMPSAVRVASKDTWQKAGCQLLENVQGIKVIVPIERKTKRTIIERDKFGNPVVDTNGEVKTQKAINDLIDNSYEVPIRFDQRLTANDCNGYYSPTSKSIYLRTNMSSSQTFKTLIHEIAHSYLHNNLEKEYDQSTAEVEAESVAYTVCHAVGVDTADYSFGYIASWSGDKELKELKNSLNRIKFAVDKILSWVCSSTDLLCDFSQQI